MKIQRRVNDNLTIELDLTGHALQMALEDGYTPKEQPTVIKCDVCQNEIPVGDREDIVSMGEPMIIKGFPRSVECPECNGEPFQGERCDFCHDRGRVDVCRACYDKWLRNEL